MIRYWFTVLTANLTALRDTPTRNSARGEDGSVTLEQVIIAAGLLAAAIGLIAVIVAAVDKYAGKIG